MTNFRLPSVTTAALAILQSPWGAMAFVKPLAVDRRLGRYLLTKTRTHAQNDTPYFLSTKPTSPAPVPEGRVSVSSDVCEQTGVTLSRYILEYTRANPEMAGIDSIFTALQTATKTISKLVRNAHFNDMLGLHNEENGGSVNIQGEEQKKLDVVTNDVLKKALKWSGKFTSFASEEEDDPVPVLNNLGREVYSNDVVVAAEENSGYVAVFDPLDGSSNVDAGIPTGTIFGVFSSDPDLNGHDDEHRHLRDLLQPGRNLVAAGYCLYSSAVTLVFTLGNGVVGFTLDENIGEFRLTHKIKIPQRGKIYSFNEANRPQWDLALQNYINVLQQGLGESKQHYSSRYIGSMVADVHRTLLYGGIFGYPRDNKNRNGKLRLLYEAAPMAFLVEQAGGRALSGNQRTLDVVPQSVHQRVPCILGSPDDVGECYKYYKEFPTGVSPVAADFETSWM
mmetsp:Transcript_9995/g.19209  ORF Transcript_9995/g.19209 Transcript_9995/m.19209 type:complete len:449 (-) Transcript_9995:223-1569(-)